MLTDGIRQDGFWNDELWILQKKDDEITYISKKAPLPREREASPVLLRQPHSTLMTLPGREERFPVL